MPITILTDAQGKPAPVPQAASALVGDEAFVNDTSDQYVSLAQANFDAEGATLGQQMNSGPTGAFNSMSPIPIVPSDNN